jgi:hypothetical protein
MFYKLACTNVKFDSTYENNIRFESRADQQSYFDVENLMANAPNVNFRIGTLLNARAVLRSDEYAVNAMLYNYCIVEDLHEDANLKYLYYFIKKITFDVSNQIILDLELDVIQTFYIDCVFEDCIVNRAHLDRWGLGSASDTYLFNTKNDSKMFEREEFKELPKYISYREKAKFIYETAYTVDGQNISNWLYEHVQAWVYVYMQRGDYTYYPADSAQTATYNFYLEQNTHEASDILYGGFAQPYAVFSFPIYKSGVIWINRSNDTGDYAIAPKSLEYFEALQGAGFGFDGKVLSVKVSPLAPFNYADYTGKYSIKTTVQLFILTLQIQRCHNQTLL